MNNRFRAIFSGSYSKIEDCPTKGYPELAFIGRSNVGKSSLINALAGDSKLARTSSSPGKTVTLNFFSISDDRYLVDLPGYGYARRSKKERERFRRLIDDYVTKRGTLFCLFVLIDCNIAPQEIDIDFITKLGEEGIPFAVVFTKADKSSATKTGKNIEAFLERLSEEWEPLPPHFITSAQKHKGIDELITYIEHIGKRSETPSND